MSLTLRLFVFLLVISGVAVAEDAIDFDRDIRPILSDNCFFCHGPDGNERQADLRLDTEEGTATVVSPGESDASELLRRVSSDDVEQLMPPPASKRKLTRKQIASLKRWIDEGAKWGDHWAFAQLTRPDVPSLEDESRVRNPIDAFVQHKVAQRDLAPAIEADRRTLIRRVTLDLTGLPPTPEEVAAFLNDTDDDAYGKVVDRLLKSPAYGERMAWDWLDAARYADSNGYQGDRERTMWPWRDWVVRAFNDNLPYDQFTVWQLAGDLLPDATFEQQLATGFCRNHMINGEGGRIPEENRVDYVMDMTETMGTVWLGLTLTCSRCHDHKYDPLTQREYYGLSAYFNQTPVTGGGGDPQTAPVLAVPDETQRQQIADFESQLAAAEDDASRKKLQKSLDDLRKRLPKVMVMQDKPERRQTFVLTRGLYNKPADEVTFGTPASLHARAADAPPSRLGLAQWLTSPDNPLTARVTVNRYWQMLFGVGLVKTTEDFGVQGERPVHRELLDWLACEFRDGWDTKELLRLIVTSHTYRQSSRLSGPRAAEDPENRLLSRGPRFRMPAWMLRDQALAASGLLVAKRGGPPVNGYQPPGVWEEATFGKKKYRQDSGEALYRRSLYTFWRRIIGPTMFFDNASRQTCTVKPFRTNTPLHALLTMNDVTFVEAARALAERVLDSDGLSAADQLTEVFERLLARPPSDQERDILLAGLESTRQEFAANHAAAEQLLSVGESKRGESLDLVEHASWTSVCLAVMNLDEALTKE